MKLLLVGDIHVRLTEIQDCQNLFDFVIEKAQTNKVDAVVFLGDQTNDHSNLHHDLRALIVQNLHDFNVRGIKTYSLLGNHDYSTTGTHTHAYIGLENLTNVVDRIRYVDGVVFSPYYFDTKNLVEDFNEQYSGIDVKYFICHQDILGGTYENGFPIKTGIEENQINSNYIISGHIHLASNFNGVEYVGSPRWLDMSSVNIDKHIMLLDTDTNERTYFDTSTVCRKRVLLADKEDSPLADFVHDQKWHYTIDIYGSESYIKERFSKWRYIANVRTFPIKSTNKAIVRESEGISTAFAKYFDAFKPLNANKDDLQNLIKERL